MSSHRFKAREAAAAQEADEQDLREIREAEFAFYFLFSYSPDHLTSTRLAGSEIAGARLPCLPMCSTGWLMCVTNHTLLTFVLLCSPGEFVIKRIKHE